MREVLLKKQDKHVALLKGVCTRIPRKIMQGVTAKFQEIERVRAGPAHMQLLMRIIRLANCNRSILSADYNMDGVGSVSVLFCVFHSSKLSGQTAIAN